MYILSRAPKCGMEIPFNVLCRKLLYAKKNNTEKDVYARAFFWGDSFLRGQGGGTNASHDEVKIHCKNCVFEHNCVFASTGCECPAWAVYSLDAIVG